LFTNNDFKLSYEFIEKTEILNKYFSSISNLNDENKVLPDFDCRCLNVLSDIEVCEQDVIDIIFFLWIRMIIWNHSVGLREEESH
jgi:hypothetical protein